jgi:membrane protease YdiL (CAAX protease family)
MNGAVTVVGLALALGGFDAAARLEDRLLADHPALDHWAVGHLLKWVVAALVVGWVLAVEGRRLASIGLVWEGAGRFTLRTGVGLVAMLGANVVMQPVWERLGGTGGVEDGLGTFAERTMHERLFVAATAGVTEEVPYRGYAIERLATLTGSAPVAGLLSGAAFVLAHHGETWDRSALLRIAQPTLVLTVLYVWTRSLPVVVAVHVLNDAVGLALADRYADVDGSEQPTDS